MKWMAIAVLSSSWGCGASVVVDGPTLADDCATFCAQATACDPTYGDRPTCEAGCTQVVETSFGCETEAHAVLDCHLAHVEDGGCALFDDLSVCAPEADALNRCDAQP